MTEEIKNEDVKDEIVETINNFSIWEVADYSVALSLWEHEDAESYSGKMYNVAINIIFSDDPVQMTTLNTMVWNEEPLTAIREVASSIGDIYENVRDHVLMFTSDGQFINDEHTISGAFEDLVDDEEASK
jgi:hypothetical protein